MSFKETYKGDYLNAETLKTERLQNKVITISGIKIQDFSKDKRTWQSFVISFSETQMTFTLDKKNGRVLAEAYGDDEQQWIGKKVMPIIVVDAKKGEVIQLVIPA